MEQKHLATPWRIKSAGGKDKVIMSSDIVVAAFQRRDKPEWNELNAAFIVRACNAYDAN